MRNELSDLSIHLHGLIIASCWAVGFTASAIDMPKAPRPYQYDTFLEWLKKSLNNGPNGGDFADVKGIGWRANQTGLLDAADWADEFDLDGPRGLKLQKFADAFKDPLVQEVNEKMKEIKKFMFFDDIIISGDLYSVATPAVHLYIMSRAAAAIDKSQNRGHNFLDVGCGPGILLQAWALLDPKGVAIGSDIDPVAVNSALKHLKHSDRVAKQKNSSQLGRTSVLFHDMRNIDEFKDHVLEKWGGLDAINVGMGMPDKESLSPMAPLLRTGGRLIAPVCKPEQPEEKTKQGKCEALLQVFQKGAGGDLEDVPGEKPIPVVFAVVGPVISEPVS